MLGNEWSNALKPDAQGFDEVRLVTFPRYKTSGLSGDEWRISASVQMFRKGVMVYEDTGWRNIETAAKFLAWILAKASDDGKAYYGGEQDKCDQEGCSQSPTVFYQLKKDWCSQCGGSKESHQKEFRKFCDEHKTRGDSSLDDCDDNYIALESNPVKP